MNTSEYHWTGSIEHATPLLLNKETFYVILNIIWKPSRKILAIYQKIVLINYFQSALAAGTDLSVLR